MSAKDGLVHGWRKRSRVRLGVAMAAIPALSMAAALVPSMASASASTATISSAGPLTNVSISSDLNCAVNHAGDADGEWFGNTACVTALALGGTLYAPESIPAGGSASPRETWTEVSQSAVTGSGTNASPYTIVTVVTAGSTGVQLTQTDSYVVGEESYNTDISVKNTGSTAQTALLYRAGDCFLQDSDTGFGIVDPASGAVTCTTSLDPGSRIEQMRPLTAGSSYMEDFYDTVWAQLGAQQAMPNTCQCTDEIDNGLGLSWPVSLAAGATKSFSSLVTFSPLGRQPVTLTKTADSSTATAGGQDGYSITVTNPNTTAVVVGSVTDSLPAGFSYRPGTTTGATTTDPAVAGQNLTFANITAPANGTATIHFGVNVSSTAGTYTNSADGIASGYTVIGTGPTAPVTVTGTTTQPVTLTKTADSSTATAGGQDAYTITATNPNAAPATLTAVDTLPAGFSYRTGTTTGATTADPAVSGQSLTFGAISVPGNGSASVHFGVNVSSTPGTYTNSAAGTAPGFVVSGTGATAPVVVSAVATQAISLTKTADSATTTAGGLNGYTITAANPNPSAVTVASLVDHLPAGFVYQAGSTSGATTANPTVSGQDLTWHSIAVPAGGAASLHFAVKVSGTAGTYTNSVTGTATGYVVTGTGPTAPVTVTAVTTTHVVNGSGTLYPASGGRATAFTFTATKTGTAMTGSANMVSPKGTFNGSQVTALTVNGHVGTVTLTGTWQGTAGYTMIITATDGTPDHVKFVVKHGSTQVFSINNQIASGSITVS